MSPLWHEAVDRTRILLLLLLLLLLPASGFIPGGSVIIAIQDNNIQYNSIKLIITNSN